MRKTKKPSPNYQDMAALIANNLRKLTGFPLELEKLENLKKWEGIFPVREKSGKFEQTGKVRDNHTKYWKILGISDKYYLLFLVMFKCTVYHLLKWIIKFLVKSRTLKKILEKSGNFVSPDRGNHG